jgi:hypothetical protein
MRITASFNESSLPLLVSEFCTLLRMQSCIVRLAIGLGTLVGFASISEANDVEFFEKEVRPLLAEHCGKCHGATKQWAELRLDSKEALLKGGENGPVVVPGKPDESRLIEAVRYKGDLQMPPDKPLAEAQVAILEKWVQLGAPWPAGPSAAELERLKKHREHWAFQPVAKVSPPIIDDMGWVRTPVDQFVRQRLDEAGLPPSPEADRRTLIRRLSYDLTGLPPIPEEVQQFVSDDDPEAYRKLVDRLLASPQYGEHWARHWLDVARYSDTKGYVYGREERVWVHAPAYRDWVVQAFNRDLPYDEFLLLQLAADQLQPNDPPSWAAMGFLTLGRRFLGVTHDIIDDRIDVVTRGTMGLTVACARCHDHKYDPIPTADYYSLYGVFLNSTEQLAAISEPAAKDEAYLAFEKELQSRQQKLRETTAAKRQEAADRVRSRITDYLVAQTELSKYPEEGFDQILAPTDVIPTFVRRWEAYLAQPARETDPVFAPWTRLSKVKPEEFAATAPQILGEAMLSAGSPINSRVTAALSPPPSTMREVAERYGKLFGEIEAEWKTVQEAAKSKAETAPTSLTDAAAEQLRQVLYSPTSPCLVPDEGVVSTEGYFDSGVCTELWKLQGEVDRWLIQSPLAPPHSVRLVDRALIRPARVFRRGNPKTRGDEVDRHFLSVVAGQNPKPFEAGSGRLELAKAIVDPTNPLTARVWVNRIWMHHFGTGLVNTPSDFGIRAERPSHPELLDWLATQLVENGWSTRHIHRLIVLSSAYRQGSTPPEDPQVLAIVVTTDPENRLLWRVSPRRMSFEEFRDTVLQISGRLEPSPGGRATDLFAGSGLANRRRTVYGMVDRQFLPPVLRVFDFANPDLHTPQRSETTVPQQALFAMNHPFTAEHAKMLVAKSQSSTDAPAAESIRRLYQTIYQRDPSPHQLTQAEAFLTGAVSEPNSTPRPETLAWQYGYGELDDATKALKSFTRLPHFTGTAWQGADQWPGGGLGWLQLTADGGHTGDDLQHSIVRRWTAPHDGLYAVQSTAVHEVAQGDGVRCYIVASRGGLLKFTALHNRKEEMNVDSLALQKGDTIDFVVDLNANLNSEQHLWSPSVRELPTQTSTSADSNRPTHWDARRDFSGPPPVRLTRLEQLAQVLLISNELMFVD